MEALGQLPVQVHFQSSYLPTEPGRALDCPELHRLLGFSPALQKALPLSIPQNGIIVGDIATWQGPEPPHVSLHDQFQLFPDFDGATIN